MGAPRSGTSYLARALGLADDVAYFEESAAFALYGARRFTKLYSNILSGVGIFKYNAFGQKVFSVTDRLRGLDRLDSMVHRMLLHTKLQPYDLAPSNPLIEVQQCCLDQGDLALQKTLVEEYTDLIQHKGAKAMLAAFFADFVRLSGKKHLLEKTPDHIGFVPVIMEIFPDAKIVLIRRDKKDSIASFLKHFDARSTLQNRFLSDRMLLKKQARTLVYYEQVEAWMMGQPWCQTIDYKHMVEKPLETICRVLEWAGLTINEELYRDLFVSGEASSNWNRLNERERELVKKHIIS